MDTTNLKSDIRFTLPTQEDCENYQNFTTLCTLKGETEAEGFARLLKNEVSTKAAEKLFQKRWVTQKELIDELAAQGTSTNPMTLYNYRQNGKIDKALFRSAGNRALLYDADAVLLLFQSMQN